MFITYLVLDPRKVNFPIYAGKGKPDRPDGIKHVLEGKTDVYAGKRFNNWLKGMRRLGYRELQIVTFQHKTEAEAFAHEESLTRQYGIAPEGGQLLNSRHGGDGGWSLSEEQKVHLSEINRGAGNSNWGTTWSATRRAKVEASWASKDRTRSPETMMKTWEKTRRKYLITNICGEQFTTDNLTTWCAVRDLPLSAFRNALKHPENIVSSGKRKSRVEGWMIRYVTG